MSDPSNDASPDTTHRSAYSFDLPREQIAQEPPAQRDQSRLMVLPRRAGPIEHRAFHELPSRLTSSDLLVMNDTRVFQARVALYRETGGRVSGLLLEPPDDPVFRMMLEGRGKIAVGDFLHRDGASFELVDRIGDGFWRVRCDDAAARAKLVETGRMPLPPYIQRDREQDPRDDLDRERYQTVFASAPGAVAAPTAGLHFSEETLRELEQRGVERATVTLHVGPGTFLPVRAERLDDHVMHAERYEIPPATADAIARTRRRGGRVIAIGTTVVRTLESAVDADGRLRPGPGETRLFIRPPYDFRVVDGLVTNFHLPESTLLMLVAAFCGYRRILDAYRVAVESGYRFFSYGDAMLIADPPAERLTGDQD